ncbi:hypothetical protein BH11PSE12_BH11PSE12_34060 [soil metagenome]
MLLISNCKNTYLRYSQLALIVLAMLSLSGCFSSVSIVNPPPASFYIPLPNEFNGTWAFEGKDRGERIRVLGQEDGTVRLNFLQTQPTNDPAPTDPFMAQTLRFDNANWLLVDGRKLSILFGDKDKGKVDYNLVRLVLDKPDRLCGIDMSASIGHFVEAIEAKQLDGKVERDATLLKSTHVTVTAKGADLVKWWVALPDSKKTIGSMELCLRRVRE